MGNGSMIHLLDEVTSAEKREITPITFLTQPATTFSQLTIETLEQGVKYVQS